MKQQQIKKGIKPDQSVKVNKLCFYKIKTFSSLL